MTLFSKKQEIPDKTDYKKMLLWVDFDDILVNCFLSDFDGNLVHNQALTFTEAEELSKKRQYGLIISGIIGPYDFEKGSTEDFGEDTHNQFFSFLSSLRDKLNLNKNTPLGIVSIIDINAPENSELKEHLEGKIAFYIRKTDITTESLKKEFDKYLL